MKGSKGIGLGMIGMTVALLFVLNMPSVAELNRRADEHKAAHALASVFTPAPSDYIRCDGDHGVRIYKILEPRDQGAPPSMVDDGTGPKLWDGNFGELVKKSVNPGRWNDVHQEYLRQCALLEKSGS